MGLFDLFRPDPRRLLARAEAALEAGDAQTTLKLARRLLTGAGLAQQHQAERLIREAHETLADRALDKARISEDAGFYDDAAEWIHLALEHVIDNGRQQELETRIRSLRERAEVEPPLRFDEDEPDEHELASGAAEADDFGDEPGDEIDLETHYDMLIAMLDDDIAPRYEERPDDFIGAFLMLNDNRPRLALETLEKLVEASPDDPVYHLERGRCRLLLEDYDGARGDFEAVWETFGDECIDRAGSISIPGLWAEAMLGLDRPAELVERLDGVADPEYGNPELCNQYAVGLLRTERFQEARDFLGKARNHFPQEPTFPYHLAAVLRALGQRRAAIDCLEASIAPSCASGQCGPRPPKHLPSLRALIALYLDEGGALDRAGELLELIPQAQGGKMAAEDYLLLAEILQQKGDTEAADQAAAEAKRLRDAAPAAETLLTTAQEGPGGGPLEAPGHKRAAL